MNPPLAAACFFVGITVVYNLGREILTDSSKSLLLLLGTASFITAVIGGLRMLNNVAPVAAGVFFVLALIHNIGADYWTPFGKRLLARVTLVALITTVISALHTLLA